MQDQKGEYIDLTIDGKVLAISLTPDGRDYLAEKMVRDLRCPSCESEFPHHTTAGPNECFPIRHAGDVCPICRGKIEDGRIVWQESEMILLANLFEDIRCNSETDLLTEDDIAAIGALTSAPIVGIEIDRDDDGKLAGVGQVYWYPDYQVKSELSELYNDGVVHFVSEC